MSFRCSKCKEAQKSGTAPIRVVVEKRDKSYFGGGLGWEIVREANLCEPCAKNHPK